MSWEALLDLVADELGVDAAVKLEKRAREDMGGARLTIRTRLTITASMVRAVDDGQPKSMAKKLGVHRATVYRRIPRSRLIR